MPESRESSPGLAEQAPLEHGGRLRAAATRHGIPLDRWLDLSTGINPQGWPVPPVPAACWGRLPEDDDGLERAARDYYGHDGLLPVAGSQAALQMLPELRAPCRVGIPVPGYAEHAQAWRRAGHRIVPLPEGDPGPTLEHLEVLVVIQPNNPTGRRHDLDRLLDWRTRLAARGGWLVVDEAFMDPTPEASLLPHGPLPGLILLRSLGKFFGLAGARVGFAMAEAALLGRLRERLGPWTLSGPSRWVATQALADRAWQAAARPALLASGARLADLLDRQGLTPNGGTPLFQWVCTPAAPRIQDALARQGILVRRFTAPASLRFGLPGTAAQWRRLEVALQSLTLPERGP